MHKHMHDSRSVFALYTVNWTFQRLSVQGIQREKRADEVQYSTVEGGGEY